MDTQPDQPKRRPGRPKGSKTKNHSLGFARYNKPADPRLHTDIHRTADPVLGFMFRQAETYGLGYIPPSYGGETREQILEKCRDMTKSLMCDMLGPRWPEYVETMGADKDTMRHVKGERTNALTPKYLRLAQLTLMQHLAAIKDHLYDLEREIWVAIQLTHHPMLAPRRVRANAQNDIAKDIGADNRRGKKLRLSKLGTSDLVLVPLRAVGMLKHKDTTPLEAYRRELKEEVAEGLCSERWQHSLPPKVAKAYDYQNREIVSMRYNSSLARQRTTPEEREKHRLEERERRARRAALLKNKLRPLE